MKYILLQSAAALLLFVTWPFLLALLAFLLLYFILNKLVKAFFKLIAPVDYQYRLSDWQLE